MIALLPNYQLKKGVFLIKPAITIRNKWLFAIESISLIISIYFSLFTNGSALLKAGLLILTGIINLAGFHFGFYLFTYKGFKKDKKLFNLQDTAGFLAIIIADVCGFIPQFLFPIAALNGPALLGWKIGYYLFGFNVFSVCYAVIYWLLFWRRHRK